MTKLKFLRIETFFSVLSFHFPEYYDENIASTLSKQITNIINCKNSLKCFLEFSLLEILKVTNMQLFFKFEGENSRFFLF